jgi:positive regulator of sigma E activity
MLNRLLNIFKSESEKTQLLVIVMIAFVIQMISLSFRQAAINTLLQLIVAWVFAYVYSKYINKTSNSTQTQLSKGFFILIVLFAVIKNLFF